VALYLMTAPTSNLIGLYYLPLTTICNDTGLTEAEVRLALEQITDIAQYDFDAELVWLPEAARYQIGQTMAPRDKRRPAVEREVAMVSDHPFATDFLRRYGTRFGLRIELEPEGHADAAEAPSKGLPGLGKPPFLDPAPAPAPDQNQDPPGRSDSPRAREAPEPGPDDASPRESGAYPRAAPADPPPPAEGAPCNLREALLLPLQRRAQWAVTPGGPGGYLNPSEWPEVVAAAEAFAVRAWGQKLRLGHYDRDNGVRAIVALYAAGFTPDDMETAARASAADPWFADRNKRALSSLTPEVVRRLLARAEKPRQTQDRIREIEAKAEEQTRARQRRAAELREEHERSAALPRASAPVAAARPNGAGSGVVELKTASGGQR